MTPLLELADLRIAFPGTTGRVRPVDGVSLSIRRGELLALVGESGCGKSLTSLAILRLVPPPGRIEAGTTLRFDGTDLLALDPEAMRRVRGRRIGMVFQDPMTSLNPVHRVGDQIAESARLHLGLSRSAALDRAVELLDKVGIPRARDRARDHPHQFSGGMRQRVMIAIALACDPILLLADEPTTALDVTIQAQILELIASISDEFGTAVILITHDLGIAAGLCDRISVMYGGRIVESAPTDEIFARPRMPYTLGLMESIPGVTTIPGQPLRTIDGMPPDLVDPPPGCRFAPRCTHARERCRAEEPELTGRSAAGHLARCWGTAPGGWIP